MASNLRVPAAPFMRDNIRVILDMGLKTDLDEPGWPTRPQREAHMRWKQGSRILGVSVYAYMDGDARPISPMLSMNVFQQRPDGMVLHIEDTKYVQEILRYANETLDTLAQSEIQD